MWFAKWFGGSQEDDAEPSEHPPHPAAARASNVVATPEHSSQPKTAPAAKLAPAKGFDPYNSGSFDKHKAWSRVIR
jgi:hypothetical protein